jgi:putative phosphoesterase
VNSRDNQSSSFDRVASVSDVHGNAPALEAVLTDIAFSGAQALVVCGDTLPGPMPEEVLALLDDFTTTMPVLMLRGNADREVFSTATPLAPELRRSVEWTRMHTARDRLDRLAQLPIALELRVAGKSVCFCHATPHDDAHIFTVLSPPERVAKLVAPCAAETIVCGHTHMQFVRAVQPWTVVNGGSVGMPYEGRRGAFWALLGAREPQLRVTRYDLERAVERFRSSGYPETTEVVQMLLEPPSSDAVARHFERVSRKHAEER